MAADITSRNSYKVLNTMYDWSKSKIKVSGIHSEKKFKKLYSSLKFHNTEIALFPTILKIMSLDIMSRNSYKDQTPCIIGQ